MNPSTTASEPGPGKIWRSETNITIPSADILSYAFANPGHYQENKAIFVDANNPSLSITAHDARTMVRKLIKGLKEHGMKEGDRLCLVAYNNISWPLLWLAVIGCGGVVAGSNPGYTSSEFTHNFKTVEPKFLIVQLKCLPAVEIAAEACNISPATIFIDCGHDQTVPAGKQSWRSLLLHGECDWNTHPGQYSNIGHKPASLCSTSGTTGVPKAAVATHRFIVAQAAMLEQRFKHKPYEASQLVCLPVFHAFAAQIALVLPLRLGITCYLLPRYSEPDFLRAVKNFNITDAALVPPMVTSLLKLPKDKQHCLQSLRYILCAGAPIAANLQSRLYEVLSRDAVIAQVWGATEVGWASMFNYDEKDLSGSVGRLQPGVELKLVSEGNAINEDLVHGEAYIRSPSMFTHYRNDSAATAEAFDNQGFYRTGDRVYMQEGKVFIDGRVKDTFKVNGWQVSPSEIEGVLVSHPRVADAAVFPLATRDANGLEITRPRAHVVPRVGADLSELADSATQDDIEKALLPLTSREVVNYAASKLVAYKRLTGGVRFVDKIPRSAIGKILRRSLDTRDEPESPGLKSEASIPASGSDVDSDVTPEGQVESTIESSAHPAQSPD